METLIPIIIAIAVFAFQAYANFQKEQEKARKRNFGQPPLPPLPEENAQRPTEAYPKEIGREQPLPAGARQPAPRPAFDRFSGVMDVEEVRRVRKARQQQKQQRLEVVEDTSAGAISSHTDFDLRDAVIKAAILERPYH
ncbi:hypothetical protein JHJ32_01565 [Parapedobacter sp. ISTM3]|uniref:Uncharacterized protein n=1 Tax=Parapedobacter luteus TaxID=623280 RepID=A0A1T4ZVF1_9SPHI|nr:MULTISPECIES: hypothetical protein [Parapedobacter]MBK1438664.1 hypothetical protein [Parapedobacter sp. ISTM3]SKB26585.1 hypothetical protein SAMN05660226_00144 [Parapedobacter luteus]